MYLYRTLYCHLKTVYNLNNATEDEKFEMKRALLWLFNDNNNAPFSLHSICEKGKERDFGDIGQFWKQNLTLASVFELIKENASMYFY